MLTAEGGLSAGKDSKAEGAAMSILDMIMGAAEQHPEVNGEQHASLVQNVMQMVGSRAGMTGLLQNAQSQGLGSVVQSWVGAGSNQPIDPNQVQGLLGEERINQLATRVGVSPAIASAALSRVLPVVIDKLTPQGKLPKAA
jgi:uncharacterized protein YidB (DUF937 family)